jgi:hypothetical protein
LAQRFPSDVVFLDGYTLADVNRWEKSRDKVIAFHWHLYWDLARQRAKIIEELKGALAKRALPEFTFESWTRIVDVRYLGDPLSPLGSIRRPEGGRFNIGDLNSAVFREFPALYIAEDYEAAFSERFPDQNAVAAGGLTPTQLALVRDQDIAKVTVRGVLRSVLDVTDTASLKPFVALIYSFVISRHVKAMAAQLKMRPPPGVVRTPALLALVINDPNWRRFPMNVDIPAGSQILGEIAHAAGLEAILYKSVRKSGKRCLAIFTRNLVNSDSFVELSGTAREQAKRKRLDASNCLEL